MKKVVAALLAMLLMFGSASAQVPKYADYGAFRMTVPGDTQVAQNGDQSMLFSGKDLLFVPLYQEVDTSGMIKDTDEETFKSIVDTLLAPTAKVCTQMAADHSGGCYKVACVMVSEFTGFCVACVCPTGILVVTIDNAGSQALEYAEYLTKTIFCP